MRPLPVPVRVVALAAAAVTVLAGCTGSSSGARKATPGDACTTITAGLLATTQRYVDGFGVDQQPAVASTATPTPTPSPSASPLTEQAYGQAIAAARTELAAAKCDDPTFQQALAVGLKGLHARGAIAGAVLAQLRVSLTGGLPSGPVTRTIGPTDDIAAALAAMPDGSTLVLRAGSYRLPDILVLLRAVTVRGAGRGRTVVTGAAAEAAVLLMTAKPVSFEHLAVHRVGKTAGSVVVTGPTAALTMRDVDIRGGRTDSGGGGGVGVLLSGSTTDRPAASVTFTAVGSVFSDNDAAGVAAGGSHRVAVSSSTFSHD